MTWMGRRLADFEPLWPAERRVVEEMGSGAPVEIGEAVPPTHAPEKVRLRASFVRYLAIGGCEACRTPEKGLRIAGALIEGNGPERVETRGLDLEGCTVSGDLALILCRIPDGLLLRGAHLAALFLNGSRLEAGLAADGLHATDGVYLREVDATGGVRLVGARLGSSLVCTGATFRGETDHEGRLGPALSADGLEAKGGVLLESFDALGQVRLVGATLGVSLECIGATFQAETDAEGQPGRAFVADGLKVKGAIFLRGGTKVMGVLDLTDAEAGALCDAPESWPPPGCLRIDRFRYGAILGSSPVDAASRLEWLGRQDAANWGAGFSPQPYVQCAQVLREMGHEGDARAILIKKERLQRKSVRDVLRARLRGARLRFHVESEGVEASGEAIGRELNALPLIHPHTRMTFAELQKAPAFREWATRIGVEGTEAGSHRPALSDLNARLARCPADLPSTLDADERAVAALSPILDYRLRLIGHTMWDWFVGAVIGYGRRPQIAGLWALGFLLLGWFVFAWAAGNGGIKPGQPVMLREDAWVECRAGGEQVRSGESQLACFLRQPEAQGYPDFNAFIYSADTLLPIVDLEMQRFWIPDEKTGPGRTARVYLWVHIVVGWALSLLAVAGFSGLVRSD